MRSSSAPPAALELVEVAGGTRLRLRVKAGARTAGMLGIHAGALKLSVTAAPERGRANRAVLELLADALGLPVSSLTLVSGRISQDKTIFVPLPPASVEVRLALKRAGSR